MHKVLSADCDLDLWPSDMVLVCNTSSCHEDHLCQIIFKSHNVRLSYGPNMILKYTNTHTDRENSICPSAIFMAGGIKKLNWPKRSCFIKIDYRALTKTGLSANTDRPCNYNAAVQYYYIKWQALANWYMDAKSRFYKVLLPFSHII